MTRFLFALMLLACTTLPAIAQTLAEGQVLRGHFIQERQLKGFQHPMRSEGVFTLVPGKGLIWRTRTPFPSTTIITPGGLAQESGGTETLKLTADRMPFLSRFYAMLGGALTGDWSGLEDQFTITRGGSDQTWTLDLVPRKPADPAMPLAAIAVTGGRFVDSIDLIKTNGDRDRLVFSSQTLTTDPLPADERDLLDKVR